MRITLDWIKERNADLDLVGWFSDRFPDGGEYSEICVSLIRSENYKFLISLDLLIFLDYMQAENLSGYIRLSCDKLAYLKTEVSNIRLQANIGSDLEQSIIGYYCQQLIQGEDTKQVLQGEESIQVASGDSCIQVALGSFNNQIVDSYNGSQVILGGRSSQKAKGASCQQLSVGDSNKVFSSGDYSRAISSGCNNELTLQGRNSVAVGVGHGCSASVGKNGVLALVYWDEGDNRPRVAVGYAGEDGIEEGEMYHVVNGELRVKT